MRVKFQVDLKFQDFKRKLKTLAKNSDFTIIKETEKQIIIEWERSFAAYKQEVTFYFESENEIFVEIDNSRVVYVLAVIWLAAGIVFFMKPMKLIVSLVLASVLVIWYSRFYTKQQIKKFLEQLKTVEVEEESRAEQQEQKVSTDLVCPACGEELTPYDEYCPNCGLYLGPTFKKQRAARTGLFNFRLVYKYKPTDKQ